MAYVAQNFTTGNVLTEPQLDQIEENIKAHAHGTGDISPIATNLLLLSKYATLQAAITAIGATETTLILDASKNASNSAEAVTVPSTLSLMPMRGGMIVKGSATSLTINSTPVGNPMHQWLSGFTYGQVTFGSKVNKAYSTWFGLSPDNIYTVNDTALRTFVAAIMVNGVPGHIPRGTYLVMDEMMTTKTGTLILSGDGIDETIFSHDFNNYGGVYRNFVGSQLIPGTATHKVNIKDFTIKMINGVKVTSWGAVQMAAEYSSARRIKVDGWYANNIVADQVNNTDVRNCVIMNAKDAGIRWTNSSYSSAEDNLFVNCTHEALAQFGNVSYGKFIGNTVISGEGVAAYSSDGNTPSNLRIQNNYFIGCANPILWPSSSPRSVLNSITGNIFYDCKSPDTGIIRLHAVEESIIANNIIRCRYAGGGAGVIDGIYLDTTKNNTVYGNHIYDSASYGLRKVNSVGVDFIGVNYFHDDANTMIGQYAGCDPILNPFPFEIGINTFGITGSAPYNIRGGTITISDDIEYDTLIQNRGFFYISTSDNEHAFVLVDESYAITLVNNTANIVTTDTDTKWCLYFTSNTLRVKNRVGATKNFTISAFGI